jgi:Methylmalonyl-CoA mutase
MRALTSPRPPSSCSLSTRRSRRAVPPATSVLTRLACSRTGRPADTPGHLHEAALLAECCTHEFPGVRALTVDALPYHDAGASTAQELGLSMSTAVAYLAGGPPPGNSPRRWLLHDHPRVRAIVPELKLKVRDGSLTATSAAD